MYAQLPSAFAPLLPVDIRSLKGKVIIGTAITLFTVLLVFFTIILGASFTHVTDECKDPVLIWLICSLSCEVTHIVLIFVFTFYIWKTSPTTNTG